MRFKRTVSLIAAALMLTSAAAYGEALRYDHKRVTEVKSKRQANDIVFHDFTDVDTGMLPAGVSAGTSSAGTAVTEVYDIGGGAKKNCLVLTDTDHTTSGGGAPKVVFPTDSLDGLVGIEVRMKYIKTGESDWNSLVIQLNSGSSFASRTVCASADGILNFNYGGLGSEPFEKNRIVPDNWYTIKYVMDFDNQVMDVMYKNEGTNKISQLFEKPFYTNEKFENLKSVSMHTTIRGGTWVFDYVRVSRETERMQAEDSGIEIQKGVPANMVSGPVPKAIAGRVNIKVGDKYKYTTTAPYISEKENVMVTVRNAAAVFSMACYETPEGFVIKNADNEFVFAKDGSFAKLNGKALTLSANGELKMGQLFIPVSDIAKALKYECSFDRESNTLSITSAKEGGENKNESK